MAEMRNEDVSEVAKDTGRFTFHTHLQLLLREYICVCTARSRAPQVMRNISHIIQDADLIGHCYTLQLKKLAHRHHK